MKDLHRYAEGVKAFDVPKNFQCDICDQSKMVRKINREPQTKATMGNGSPTSSWAMEVPQRWATEVPCIVEWSVGALARRKKTKERYL